MVIKVATAHLFHVGDSRIYRVAGHALEQLTEDHRVIVSSEQSYLSRALGINPQIEIDYQPFRSRKATSFCWRPMAFTSMSAARFVADAIASNADDLDSAAQAIVEEAYRHGSTDNLTVQIVRIDELPDGAAQRAFRAGVELPPPPLLEARMVFEGYRIVREVHASSRSHIYLAVDIESDDAGHPQNSLDRSARRPGLSQAFHDGGMGRSPHQQPACPEAALAVADGATSSMSSWNSSTGRR